MPAHSDFRKAIRRLHEASKPDWYNVLSGRSLYKGGDGDSTPLAIRSIKPGKTVDDFVFTLEDKTVLNLSMDRVHDLINNNVVRSGGKVYGLDGIIVNKAVKQKVHEDFASAVTKVRPQTDVTVQDAAEEPDVPLSRTSAGFMRRLKQFMREYMMEVSGRPLEPMRRGEAPQDELVIDYNVTIDHEKKKFAPGTSASDKAVFKSLRKRMLNQLVKHFFSSNPPAPAERVINPVDMVTRPITDFLRYDPSAQKKKWTAQPLVPDRRNYFSFQIVDAHGNVIVTEEYSFRFVINLWFHFPGYADRLTMWCYEYPTGVYYRDILDDLIGDLHYSYMDSGVTLKADSIRGSATFDDVGPFPDMFNLYKQMRKVE